MNSADNHAAGTPKLALRPGVETDIPFVMQTERIEGYGELVGRWIEAEHLDAIRGDRDAYFIGMVDAEPVGFALLRDWNAPSKVAHVKRVAIASPGHGYGTAMMRLVIAEVFAKTDAERLWIGTFPENVRARRAYERAGFISEGVNPESVVFGGQLRDELILSISRPVGR